MNNEIQKDEYIFTREELINLIEWTRVNGERWRGNLQKNGIELYNQYLKEKEYDKVLKETYKTPLL